MRIRSVSGVVTVLLGSVTLLAHAQAPDAQSLGEPLRAKIRFESTPPSAVVTVLQDERVVIRGRTPAAFVLTWNVDQPLQVVFTMPGHEECRRQIVIRRANRVEGAVVVHDSVEQRFPLGSLRHKEAPVVECTLRRPGRDDQ